MSDSKVPDLTGLPIPASGDKIYILDISDTTDSADGSSRSTTLGALSTGIVVTSLDITGLTASELIRLNSGGTALESAGLAVASIVTLTGVQTLTQKTLTAPIITGPTISGTVAGGATYTSPVFTAPTLGAATATSINKITITAPAASATLTLVTGSSLITAGAYAITLTSTNTTNATLPAGTVTLVGTTSTDTLTNKRITKRVTTITSSATPTINSDDCDCVTITALATAITSMTSGLSGTPTNFQTLLFRILDDATAHAITWGAKFEARGVDLPTTTTISKLLTVGFVYDTVDNIWGCVFVSEEA